MSLSATARVATVSVHIGVNSGRCDRCPTWRLPGTTVLSFGDPPSVRFSKGLELDVLSQCSTQPKVAPVRGSQQSTTTPRFTQKHNRARRRAIQASTTIAHRYSRSIPSGKYAFGSLNRWTNKTSGATLKPNPPSQSSITQLLAVSRTAKARSAAVWRLLRSPTWPRQSDLTASSPTLRSPLCHRTAVGRTWPCCRHTVKRMMQEIDLFSSFQVRSVEREKMKPDQRNLIRTTFRAPPLAQGCFPQCHS